MTEQNIENTPEVKEKIIGTYKPSRKFLNFVSAISGARIRLISDIAFVKGDKLSGLGLDGVIFKVTICDEGTINFEEVDTNVTDEDQRKRLIEDICSMDVTGYAQKFVISGLEFADKDGSRCYLEIEEKKPIDKLKSLFNEMEPKEISDKGLNFLDELLGGSSDTNSIEEELVEAQGVVEPKDEVKEEVKEDIKSHAESMIAESFRKMNEDKINELKSRIEDKEKDIKKAKNEISQAEKKVKESSEQLQVLNTRLETMSVGDDPNGYVFFVTEEQKNETGLDESTRSIADKIADLMNLKKDVLFNYLTGGFYKIKIGKKGENDKKLESIDKDIFEKILSIDLLGKISMTDSNEFEYRGDLNWHQLTGKMIRKGFEQDPEFNKISGSNSYESKVEDDGGSYTGTKKEESCSHDNCGCSHTEGKEENSTELKTKPLVFIKESTDIVIVGAYSDKVATIANFSITDDYSGFDVMVGNKKLTDNFESDGFVNVMSVGEFIKYLGDLKSQDILDDFFDAQGAVYLPNFKGDIKIGVMDGDGKSDYDFNPSDEYIQHQIDEYVNVFISLPDGTNTIPLNDPKDFASIFREEKLNSILNG